MMPRSRVLNGFVLHWQRNYVLSKMAYLYLIGRGYNLQCPVCNLSIVAGNEVSYLKKQHNPNKTIFHRKCYETLPLPIEPKKPRIETKTVKPLKQPKQPKYREQRQPRYRDELIKPKKKRKFTSSLTSNLYHCWTCKKDVHAKVTREDNRIVSLSCEICGDLFMENKVHI